MARIAGVDLPKYKRSAVALTYIYGIGNTVARDILEAAEIDPNTKVKDLTDEDITKIRQEISNIKVEGELKADVQSNIKRLMDVGCYRGIRHRKGLPLRGQRTQTNARQRKGKRKTVAGKKKAPK